MSSTAARTSGAVTVGTSSVALIGANIGRREITICNDHATQVVYLMLATNADVLPTAVANQGIRLNAAGGSWTSNMWDGAVAAIASGADTPVTVVEF